jgi:hypothetical protein
MTVAENDLLVGPVTPANGVTLISIDYYFEDEADLEVYKSGSNTPLTITADYTVSEPTAVNATDGSITLTTPANGTDRYSIYLKQPLQRSSDLQFRGDLRSPVLNVEFDRLWRAIQGINTALDRVFRFSQTSTVPDPLDAEAPADRADKIIGFSEDGTGLALIVTPAQLATLAELTAELEALGAIAADITTAAGIETEIAQVAAVDGDVAALGPIAADISDVAAIDEDVTAVAAIEADVTVVAASIADVTNFADVYVGPAASDPATRTDGSALQAGDLYFNTTDDELFVYDGENWAQAAFTAAGFVTLTGTQTLTNKTLARPVLRGSEVDVETFNVTGTAPLSLSNGAVQNITLTGNLTLTDGLGTGGSVIMHIDDGSAYSITWPTITWISDGGDPPTLQTSGTTVITVWKVGSTLYGFASNGA